MSNIVKMFYKNETNFPLKITITRLNKDFDILRQYDKKEQQGKGRNCIEPYQHQQPTVGIKDSNI